MADTKRLVKTFLKIRDKKAELKRAYDEKVATLDEQLGLIRSALLEHCKEHNEEGGKTEFGTFSRVERSKYWTSDWEKFGDFVIDHKVPELLEKRIQQTNMRTFLEQHPDIDPPGLRLDKSYDIVVRRASK